MVPIIPRLDYHQWLKYINLSFGKSIHLEEFSMLVFIIKTICYSKKKLSRDLCSPGSRQLLQLQPFSQILKFWTLLFLFYLAWDCLVSWNLSFLCYKLWFFEDCGVCLFSELNICSPDDFVLSLSEVYWRLIRGFSSLCHHCFGG